MLGREHMYTFWPISARRRVEEGGILPAKFLAYLYTTSEIEDFIFSYL